MTRLYGLTETQVERLKRLLDRVESGEPIPVARERQWWESGPDRIIVGLVDSSIAATTSLTGPPVPGTLNVYGFTSAGTTDTGRDETVYNFAPQAATTDRWTIAERDDVTGKWVITTQFCS